MRSTLLALVLIAASAAIASSILPARPAQAGPNCDADTALDSREAAFLDLINDYLADNMLGPLFFSDPLNQASALRSGPLAPTTHFGGCLPTPSPTSLVISPYTVSSTKACRHLRFPVGR